jgi:predicted RecA/RadA family phage recombinase
MVDYDAGGGTVNAGDVVLVGPTPYVAHEAIPAYTGGSTRDALAAEGGVYECQTDGTGVPGEDVYWDNTNKKITATAIGNTHFGVMLTGPTFLVGGAGPAADGDLCWVLHKPKEIAANVQQGVFSEATASATATLTAAQVQGGFIDSAPGGAITLTSPTAAQLVAQFVGCKVGDKFECVIENTAGAANTITFAAGAGITYRGETSIAQNKALILKGVFTNVTPGTEAVTLYGITGA